MSNETPDAEAARAAAIEADVRAALQQVLREMGELKVAHRLDGMTLEEIDLDGDPRIERAWETIIAREEAVGESAIAAWSGLKRVVPWAGLLTLAVVVLFWWLIHYTHDGALTIGEAADDLSPAVNAIPIVAAVLSALSGVMVFIRWMQFRRLETASSVSALRSEYTETHEPPLPLPPSGVFEIRAKPKTIVRRNVGWVGYVVAAVSFGYLLFVAITGGPEAAITIGATLAVVALIIAISIGLMRRGRVTYDGSVLRYRRALRTKSYPRAEISKVVHVVVEEYTRAGTVSSPMLLLLNKQDRVIAPFNVQQWSDAELYQLFRTVDIPVAVTTTGVSIDAIEALYPGTYSFARRHPILVGLVGTFAILAAVIAIVATAQWWDDRQEDAQRERSYRVLEQSAIIGAETYRIYEVPTVPPGMSNAEGEAVSTALDVLDASDNTTCATAFTREKDDAQRFCLFPTPTERYQARMTELSKNTDGDVLFARSKAEASHEVRFLRTTPIPSGFTVDFEVRDDGKKPYTMQVDMLESNNFRYEDILLFEVDDTRCNNDPATSIYKIKKLTTCQK